jgi:serine/threonine-protein kinase
MAHLEGNVIAGRYRLERELARGGMGSVFAAHDTKLRRSVAIKLLVSHTTLSSLTARRRFEREAMAVAQLQSTHIVQVYDYGVEDDCPYMVMELLYGEDLRSRLNRRKRLGLEEAGRILIQTAKGLSVAHAAGIVHRDLKPGNIFLVRDRDDEIAKVLDFGVAKDVTQASELDQDTKDGSILGTPRFMAPEQARGIRTVDHRADLWSLGVILFRALTGQLPFDGPTAADLIVKLCTNDAPSARELAPDLPPEVDAFFAQALARDPDRRFATARELALAFTRLAPVSLPPISMPAPSARLARLMRDSGAGLVDLDDATHVCDEALAPFTRASAPGRAQAAAALGEREPLELGPAEVPAPPSHPTLEGGLAEAGPSQRPPSARTRTRSDRTLIMALAAVVSGALLALAGSLVMRPDASPALRPVLPLMLPSTKEPALAEAVLPPPAAALPTAVTTKPRPSNGQAAAPIAARRPVTSEPTVIPSGRPTTVPTVEPLPPPQPPPPQPKHEPDPFSERH